jgi:YggT family protein
MPFLNLLMSLIHIYQWIVIIQVILSLLFQFNVLNTSSPFAQQVYAFLTRLVEPALRFVRRKVKPINGIDVSPLILLLGLELLRQCLGYYVSPILRTHGI